MDGHQRGPRENPVTIRNWTGGDGEVMIYRAGKKAKWI